MKKELLTTSLDGGRSTEGQRLSYDTTACGRRIRQLRRSYGYTQEALADLLGIDRSFLSRIEAGTKGCSVDLFIALAEVFHTSLDHLILGTASNEKHLKQEIHTLIKKLTELEQQL